MSSSPTIPAFSPDMNLVCSFLEKISFKLAPILRGPGSQPAGNFPAAELPLNPPCPDSRLFACKLSGTLKYSLLQY